jgi:hypothetical protein
LAIGTALVEVPLAFAASWPAAVQAGGAVCYPSILFREHATANPPLRRATVTASAELPDRQSI